ncbi:MAG TPA: GFA family protein [Burkholderiaceae bacterium]
MSAIQGGCRCGAVRYTLALNALPRTYACHCRDCQTWSGSAFSQQTFLPDAALSVTGPLAIFEMTYPSGRVSTQRMCGLCHTRIYNTNSARPGIVVVRAGTLDRSDELEVVAHIWVKRKQPWLALPAGAPAWPEGAPPAELLQALRSPSDTAL